ncbi:uncharacterized protein LOC123566525 [Mercenaria mercenaria]|uniref:uncharacterized protein LOC123566525 n=1 Tax=Mercenaria mercenaria TaxID=6596 RepID=UPI00234FA866|nr:uncharacterized protein LOC123566525 [Mercenaria mercenaria]
MGAGASLEIPVKTENTSASPLLSTPSENSSGYHSNIEDLDTLASMQSQTAQTNQKIMPKRPLASRPSVIIGAVTKQQQEREEELENKNVKKSPELKKVFEGFEQCKKFLLDQSKRNERYYEPLNKMLKDNVTEAFSKFDKDEQRMVMANRLARINFVQALVGYYNFVYDDLDVDGISYGFVDEANQVKEKKNKDPGDHGTLLVLTIREILWNFSDSSHKFSEMISQTDLFTKLVHDLEIIKEEDLQDMADFEDMDLFAFNSAVGILHNCARNPDIDKQIFRDLKVTKLLYPFLRSTVYVKMITLLALGNIVTEEEVSKLAAEEDVIDFLLKAIVKALNAPDRKEHGFHLTELVDGLAAIAQSDTNKSKVVSKENLLATLVKIIQGKVTTEVLACVKLVWQLAFLSANKSAIKKDKELMKTLDSLRKDADYDIKTTANSAWFVLVDQDERLHHEEEMKKSHKKTADTGKAATTPGGKHIMISYCWKDKETVLKIHQILENEGYPTWIDVKEMNKYANLLEGMARAVEEAYVILICFSEQYRNSQNCRTEADYAYAQQKNIVPLKMQRGYKPDGWLGALIGARLYIEFSPHYPFDDQMKKVRDQIKLDDEPPPVVRKPDVPDTTSSAATRVRVWTRSQIDSWITEHKLQGSAFKQVKRMTGEQLEFLYKVMIKSPDTFYRWLEMKLELKTLEDLMKFDRAVQALGKHVSH